MYAPGPDYTRSAPCLNMRERESWISFLPSLRSRWLLDFENIFGRWILRGAELSHKLANRSHRNIKVVCLLCDFGNFCCRDSVAVRLLPVTFLCFVLDRHGVDARRFGRREWLAKGLNCCCA